MNKKSPAELYQEKVLFLKQFYDKEIFDKNSLVINIEEAKSLPRDPERIELYKRGMEAFRARDYVSAKELLEPAIAKASESLFFYDSSHLTDFPDACLALGEIYEHGLGTEVNTYCALGFYRYAIYALRPEAADAFLNLIETDPLPAPQYLHIAKAIEPLAHWDDDSADRYLKDETTLKGSTNWENVYLFISSTFNDMHAERDYLVKRCIPILRERCAALHLKLIEIDLRWGISEEDAAINKQVVDICLNNIDKCRPFFLCFLGQRSGWIPGLTDINFRTLLQFPRLKKYIGKRSVTELEIIHAVLEPLHEKITGSPSAFFYFRDDDYLNAIEDPKVRQLFSPDSKNKDPWAYFRKELPDTYPTHVYRGRWDNELTSPELTKCGGADLSHGRLTDFTCGDESLMDSIIRELMAAILKQYPDHADIETDTALSREQDAHARHLFRLSESYIPRKQAEDHMLSYIDSDEPAAYLLEASAGMGKSTLLSSVITRCLSRPESRLIYRFIGITANSLENTLISVYRQMAAERLLTQSAFAKYQAEPLLLFKEALMKVSDKLENERLLIFIDGLDQAIDISDMSWIPSDLPGNIRLVMSVQSGTEVSDKLHESGQTLHLLPPMTDRKDKQNLISGYLSQYLKTVDNKQINLLLAMKGSDNPLFLKIILNELRQFGSFDALSDYLSQDYGSTPQEAFLSVISRLQMEYSQNETADILNIFLGCTAWSLGGVDLPALASAVAETKALGNVSESDIRDTFMFLARELAPFVTMTGNTLDFLYNSLRQAVIASVAGDSQDYYRLLYESCRISIKHSKEHIFGVYYYSAAGGFAEPATLMDPHILYDAVVECGTYQIASELKKLGDTTGDDDYTEISRLMLSSMAIIDQSPKNLFFRIEASVSDNNRAAAYLLDVRKKTFPIPHLVRRQKKVHASEAYFSYPLLPEATDNMSVHIAPPWIIRISLSEKPVCYVADIVNGNILRTKELMGRFSSYFADDRYLYCCSRFNFDGTDGHPYAIYHLPEMTLVEDGSLPDPGRNLHFADRIFGFDGRIFAMALDTVYTADSPFPQYAQVSIICGNGPDKGKAIYAYNVPDQMSADPLSLSIYVQDGLMVIHNRDSQDLTLIDLSDQRICYETQDIGRFFTCLVKKNAVYLISQNPGYHDRIVKLERNADRFKKSFVRDDEADIALAEYSAIGDYLVGIDYDHQKLHWFDKDLDFIGNSRLANYRTDEEDITGHHYTALIDHGDHIIRKCLIDNAVYIYRTDDLIADIEASDAASHDAAETPADIISGNSHFIKDNWLYCGRANTPLTRTNLITGEQEILRKNWQFDKLTIHHEPEADYYTEVYSAYNDKLNKMHFEMNMYKNDLNHQIDTCEQYITAEGLWFPEASFIPPSQYHWTRDGLWLLKRLPSDDPMAPEDDDEMVIGLYYKPAGVQNLIPKEYLRCQQSENDLIHLYGFRDTIYLVYTQVITADGTVKSGLRNLTTGKILCEFTVDDSHSFERVSANVEPPEGHIFMVYTQHFAHLTGAEYRFLDFDLTDNSVHVMGDCTISHFLGHHGREAYFHRSYGGVSDLIVYDLVEHKSRLYSSTAAVWENSYMTVTRLGHYLVCVADNAVILDSRTGEVVLQQAMDDVVYTILPGSTENAMPLTIENDTVLYRLEM